MRYLCAFAILAGLLIGCSQNEEPAAPVAKTESVDVLVGGSRCGRMQPSLRGRVAVIGMHEFEPPSTGRDAGNVPPGVIPPMPRAQA